MVKKRSTGLGRGLSALMEDSPAEGAAVAATREVPIEHLHPNRYQPRVSFNEEALRELTASIAERGVLQPILVRDSDDHPGEFEIVAGERRWRAAQRARLHRVPIVERSFSDQEALEVAIMENVQRQDLSAIEEALAYQRLVDEFDYGQKAVADAVGKSRPHVANMLRLLSLPEKVQAMVNDGRLSMGHARALVGADEATWLAGEIIRKGLNVRQTEALLQQGKPNKGKKRGLTKDANTRALEKQISDQLGLPVSIDAGRHGGKITIKYKTLEQFESIADRLSG
ncbi:MAG: ParB/RepB/Spo0J family partition protein [Alphaproteobacteria bacterium]